VQRTKWALGFVMMVFGLLITTQLRVQQQLFTDPGKLRANEISVELKATAEKLRASEAQRARLEADLDKLLKAPGTIVIPSPVANLTDLEIFAGTVEVQGEGVTVIISESTELSAAKTPLSDEDLWRVVNELLVSGAEALSVGGERFTSATGIRNVGQRIMVNNKMISSPVAIEVVGDPVVIEAALRMRNGVVDSLGRWGIKVLIQRKNNIKIPAAGPIPIYRYAKPVPKPGP
jgi:uncharacterized protein YlxW (UPF0749 family)